jgi:hypothetical protein
VILRRIANRAEFNARLPSWFNAAACRRRANGVSVSHSNIEENQATAASIRREPGFFSFSMGAHVPGF